MKSSITGPRMLFTAISGNRKTGPIAVSMTEPKSCPDTCPFKQNGCMALYGPLKIHWDRLKKGTAGITWNEFISKVSKLWRGSLWRMNQAGDLPHEKGKIVIQLLRQLIGANKGKSGFGYSHHEVLSGPNAKDNRKSISEANKNGFTINLSGNNPAHADKLKALGIAPVVCVVPANTPKTSLTPAGNRVVVCPAQYDGSEINCLRCGFCQRADRNVIIGFWPHGSGAKYVEAKSITTAN